MVAQNSLFHGGWSLKKLKLTVINDIWPEALFFTMVAVMVSLVSNLTDVNLSISNVVMTVLGTVLGLVISFRTLSAYERYHDCRKMWSDIGVASRNLAQIIWIHVKSDRSVIVALQNKTDVEVSVEKKTMIDLIQAFSVSLKHSLREETGIYYTDLYPLIHFFPRHVNTHIPHERLPLRHSDEEFEDATSKSKSASLESAHDLHTKPPGRRSRLNSFDPESPLPRVWSEHLLKSFRNPPKTHLRNYIPLFQVFSWMGRIILGRTTSQSESKDEKTQARKHVPGVSVVQSRIPLEILLVLSNYSTFLTKHDLIQPAGAAGFANNLALLQDTLSHLERICNTPLPFAYQAHLRMSLWLYLLFLPFQIFDQLGYLTIPGTCFSSFLLLGFLEIGDKIATPFAYDLNDLDLDHFCLSLKNELHQITAHNDPDPSDSNP